MKDTMDIVFDIIKMHVLPNVRPFPKDFDAARWVYGNKSDEEWLTRVVLKESIEISLDIRFSLWNYDNKNYFVISGLELPSKLPDGYEYEAINAGFFTAIIAELELPIKTGISKIYVDEHIMSQSKDEPTYVGHDFNDLAKVFPNIVATKITNRYSGLPGNLSQLASIYIAQNSQFIPLKFMDKTMGQILSLCYVNSSILNYDNILQALFSSNFKFAFLDLYRCVELLFQLVYVDETYEKLKLTIDKTIFLSALDNELSWKPVERNAIKKIFILTPDSSKKELINLIQKISGKKVEHSDWYYDLRCSIVHLKTIQKKFEIHKSQWNELIGETCQVLNYWYSRFPDFK